MSTINQLVRNQKRITKISKNLLKALASCPQKKGIVQRVYIETPKKPNSAKRQAAKVIISYGLKKRIIRCHIPGEGHTLTKHSIVLIRGGRTQDLIGYRYKPIRGKFDCKGVQNRISRPTKYGVKKR